LGFKVAIAVQESFVCGSVSRVACKKDTKKASDYYQISADIGHSD